MKSKNNLLPGLGFLLGLTLLLSSCSGAGEADSSSSESSVSASTDGGESEDSLAGAGSSSDVSSTDDVSEEVDEIAIKSTEDFVRITLVEFSVSNQKCSFGDGSLEIRAVLTNVTDKAILAAEVDADILDVFGESIGRGFNISTDETIAPGADANLGTWGNSCFRLSNRGDDRRLLEMKDELDTKANLVISVTRIAFDDGEVVQF